MKKAERLLSLLLVLALASACIPAAAETKNVRTLFSMRTVELLTADGLTVTAGGEVREEYTEGRKKKTIRYYIPISVTNTTDKQYQVFFPEAFLNGRYVGFSLISSTSAVRAGETHQLALDLSCSVLEAYGVTSLNQIQSLEVKVGGTASDSPYREFGTIQLSAKLLGLSLRKAARIPNADEIKPQTLFETDGVVLRTDGLTPDGKALSLCLTNNRAEMVIASVQNIIVNGWQIPLADRFDAVSGGNDGMLLEFGDAIPDFGGPASIAFDLTLLCREEQTWLETGEEQFTRLHKEPVRISLAPAHPAKVSEPEGWIPAAEQDGLQILYSGGFSRSRSYVVLPLMFINQSEQKTWLSCQNEPGLFMLPIELRLNGQPSATEGFLECFHLVGPGARSAATLCITNKSLSGTGIKWNGIRTVDFSLFLYSGSPDKEPQTIPVHIDFE